MWRFALRQPLAKLARGLSTVQRGTSGKRALLSQAANNTGRRFLGYEADISTAEALAYVFLIGGGVATFGMYQTMQLHKRIEAYETGQVIPYEGLSDDEVIKFKEKIAKIQAGEEEESQEEEEIPDEDFQTIAKDVPGMISKSEKDTVIFIEAPKN